MQIIVTLNLGNEGIKVAQVRFHELRQLHDIAVEGHVFYKAFDSMVTYEANGQGSILQLVVNRCSI